MSSTTDEPGDGPEKASPGQTEPMHEDERPRDARSVENALPDDSESALAEPGPVRVLRVAVPAPLAELYDYLPPPDRPAADLAPGTRVLVPFGRGRRVGLVVEQASSTDLEPDRLKPIAAVLGSDPLFGSKDLELIRWAADYYRHPLGEALFTALPGRLRRGSAVRDDRPLRWVATSVGLSLDLRELGRAASQRRALELLRESPEGLEVGMLRVRSGASPATLRSLRQRSLIEQCRVQAEDGADAPEPVADAVAPGLSLNAGQARAVGEVEASLGTFQPFLLEGVTGSGKTEVYVRLIRAAIARGGQALLLVPEIGLAPQTLERLRRRISGQIATIHSSLPDSERERAWLAAASGRANLLLGTRSACFVPLPRLALILVDEEHDPSLKQQEGFRYSARDLAVLRARQRGCPVVLGSATPSLETLHNAHSGRYRWLRLPERAGGAKPPSMALLDIRGQPLTAGMSPLLRAHVEAELGNGNQVLLFLNRRGFAPVLTCHECGWVGGCPHCDARLTLHMKIGRLWCHHCGWLRPIPERCPDCRGLDLRGLGLGTERLENELAGVFPDVPVGRIDRDSTRRKGELERLLAQVRSGEIKLLLGTQMLAKGHDFPAVTLVGILDLDHSLYAADFRAPERTAALVVQVAGRAGRAERPGRVVIQTRHPAHPLLRSLLDRGYPGFAELALAERQQAGLPPYGFLALLRADAPQSEPAMEFLSEAARLARAFAVASHPGGVTVRGPVPSPMQRRAGRFRAQLLLESSSRAVLQNLLGRWILQLRTLTRRGDLRWSLDVDPQELT